MARRVTTTSAPSGAKLNEKEDIDNEPSLEGHNAHIVAFVNLAEAHIVEFNECRIPAFLRRDTPLEQTKLNFILRPHTEWIMPSNRGAYIVKTIEAKDRNLPVEVTVKTSVGASKEEFANMEAFEAWFDPKNYTLEGHIADESMTMINVTLNETKVAKAKPPSKTVVKKAEQVVADRAKQSKKDAKEKANREKAQVVTDKKEEARAKKFHKEVEKTAKEIKAERGKAEKAGALGLAKNMAKVFGGKAVATKGGAAIVKGGKPSKGKTAQAAAPAKPAKAPSANGVVRTGVKVDGPSMKGEEFASIAKFYLAIKKPLDAGFQKLRKEVKTSGKGSLKTDKGDYKLTAI